MLPYVHKKREEANVSRMANVHIAVDRGFWLGWSPVHQGLAAQTVHRLTGVPKTSSPTEPAVELLYDPIRGQIQSDHKFIC